MNTSRSIILEEAERWLFRLILLVSVFLMVRGHNAPGGGFIGGLVAGAAYTLRYLVGMSGEAELCGRVRPRVLLGVGALTSLITALIPLFSGDALLDAAYVSGNLPIIGEYKVVSAAVFDLGVYLIVVGFVLTVLVELGQGDSTDTRGAA